MLIETTIDILVILIILFGFYINDGIYIMALETHKITWSDIQVHYCIVVDVTNDTILSVPICNANPRTGGQRGLK